MLGSLIGFFFTGCYWPWIADSAQKPRWAFLAVVGAVAWVFTRVEKVTLAHVALAALLLYAGASLAWSEVGVEWAENYSKLLFIAVAFLVAVELRSLRSLLIGAALGLCINSGVAIAQWYGWTYLPQSMAPAGFFVNKNTLAEFAAVVAIGLAYERIWWGLVLAAPSIILPEARGALAALVVVFAAAWLPARWLIIGGGAAFGTGFIYILTHFDSSIAERMALWQDTITHLSWLGHGWGSFYTTFAAHNPHSDNLIFRADHAHNDFLELTYELGLGAILAVAFFLALWRGHLATERAILLAIGVEGLFGFPLHLPATAGAFALASGRLAGAGPDLRSDLHSCRTVLYGWLGQRWRSRNSRAVLPRSDNPIPVRLPDTELDGISLHVARAWAGESRHGYPGS